MNAADIIVTALREEVARRVRQERAEDPEVRAHGPNQRFPFRLVHFPQHHPTSRMQLRGGQKMGRNVVAKENVTTTVGWRRRPSNDELRDAAAVRGVFCWRRS